MNNEDGTIMMVSVPIRDAERVAYYITENEAQDFCDNLIETADFIEADLNRITAKEWSTKLDRYKELITKEEESSKEGELLFAWLSINTQGDVYCAALRVLEATGEYVLPKEPDTDVPFVDHELTNKIPGR